MLPVTRVVGHKEWSPGRKSDPIYDMNWRRAGVAGVRPNPVTPVAPVTPAQPRLPKEDAMYIKCKPYPDRADVWVGILSGGLFVGLGSPGEKDSANLAIKNGATEQWVERYTWDAFDQASHRLYDNPRPVRVVTPAPPAS